MFHKKYSKIFAFMIIVSLFCSVVPLQPVYSMSGFGSVIDLGTADAGSQRVVSNGDNVYTVWTNGGDVYFSRSTNNGTSFESPINLSNDFSASTPAIAVSGSSVYLVWADASLGSSQIFFINSTDNGASFPSPAINVSNDIGIGAFAYGPQIAVSGNDVYVAWLDDNGTGFAESDVFFRTTSDNGITFTPDLSSNPTSLSDPGHLIFRVQLAAVANNVYTVWEDQNQTTFNYDIFFRASTDSGSTFPNPAMNLSNDGGAATAESVLTAVGNDVYVAWSDNPGGNFDILYESSSDNGATFNGGTPGAPNNLSNNSGDSRVPKLVASGSDSFVAWQDTRDVASINSEILFKKITNDGSNLAGPIINLSNDTGLSSSPQIEISGSNLFVAWQDDTLGNSETFFRSSEDGGSTFVGLQNLSDNPGFSQTPILSSTNDRVYAAWNDDSPGTTDLLFKAAQVIPVDVKLNSVQYPVNATAIVTVKDSSKANGTPDETVQVNVATTTTPAGILLDVTESGDTGVFTGTLTITSVAPASPTAIQASGGDTLTATYNTGLYGSQTTIASILNSHVDFDFALYDRGSHAHITVTDALANVNPSTIDQIPVNITSTANPSGVILTLNETGDDTGIFGGTLDSQSNLLFAVDYNGKLPVGSKVTVTQPDNAANTTAGIDTTTATVQSTSSPCPCPSGGTILTLTETGGLTAVFKGDITLSTGPSSSGVIQVAGGDILSVSHGGLTTNALVTPNTVPSTGIIQVITPSDTITASFQGMTSSASVQNAFGEGGGGGGLVRPGLVLNLLAGLAHGAGGYVSPTLTLNSLAAVQGGLPDNIKEMVLHQDPFTPIAPLDEKLFDFPFVIDGGGYALGGHTNTIVTKDETVGVPVEVKLNIPATSIEHVALYTNLQGLLTDVDQSDTYIIYEKGQPLQIVDPHGYFAHVTLDSSKDGNKNKFNYMIIFAKPMEKSHIVLRVWDDKRASSETKILNAWQVEPTSSSASSQTMPLVSSIQTPAPVTSVQTTAPVSENSPDLIPIIKDWGGYSANPVSDSEFLSHLGITGQSIPKWVSIPAKYVVDGDLTPQEFEIVVKYLASQGIIK